MSWQIEVAEAVGQVSLSYSKDEWRARGPLDMLLSLLNALTDWSMPAMSEPDWSMPNMPAGRQTTKGRG